MIAHENEALKKQKTASVYLEEKKDQLDIMLKSYIDNNERDKITAAEKRLLRRNVQNRYKEVLRDQHLKKMFEADARKNKKDSDRSSVNSDAAKSKKSKGEDSSELEEE